MPSSEMNYCRRRTGEPLRTNLSPWMPVPRVKGSAEKRTFTREPGPIVLRIPPPPPFRFGGHPHSVAPGAERNPFRGWQMDKKEKKPCFQKGKRRKVVGAEGNVVRRPISNSHPKERLAHGCTVIHLINTTEAEGN